MAIIAGSTTMTSYIAPKDDRSKLFTHTEEWNRGGYRSVATDADLSTLLATKRWSKGMLVNVLETDTIKKLVPKEGYTYEDDNVSHWEFKALTLGNAIDMSLDESTETLTIIFKE